MESQQKLLVSNLRMPETRLDTERVQGKKLFYRESAHLLLRQFAH